MLAVDPGTKRLGIAISDDMQWTARPLEVWASQGHEADAAHVVALVAEHEAGEIVVGVPYRLDGSTSRSTEKALAFVAALREAAGDTPVIERDEALTTWAAEETLKERGMLPRDRRKLIDAYAAAVILQELLDERSA